MDKFIIVDNAYKETKRKLTPYLIEFFETNDLSYKVIQTTREFLFLDLAHVKGFIFSGSHHRYSIDPHPPTIHLIQNVLKTGKPVLGICFGFQTLCFLEGAEIVPRHAPSHGNCQCVLDPSPLTKGKSLRGMFTNHYNDKVVSIPSSYTILGRDCETHEPVAIGHKARPHFGVQFHPEVSGKDGHDLLWAFVDFSLKF